METSLTGKALNFGFSDCEFDSRVSNIPFYSINYLLGQFNINLKKKKFKFIVRYTAKIFYLLKIFKKCGLISTFFLIKNKTNVKILIHIFYSPLYRVFNDFKIISKPKKFYYISLYSLKLLSLKLANSYLILSTTKGIMDHHSALFLKTGGIVLAQL